MAFVSGGQWCEVELDLFDPADFVEEQDRLFHVYHIPGGLEPHCADGFLADGRPWSGLHRGHVFAGLAGLAGLAGQRPAPTWSPLFKSLVGRQSEVRIEAQPAVKRVPAPPARAARTATDEAVLLRKAAFDAELDRDKTIHDARVELVKGSLDRARSDAEFVRNAAAGILAIYQAVLGLGFVAKDVPIHLSAVLGTMFLAFAVASASAYVAWIGRASGVDAPIPTLSLRDYQARRLNTFTDWVASAVNQRAAWLHFAVVCLFLGSLALPLPFLTIKNLDQNDPALFGAMAVAGLAAALILANSPWRWRPGRRSANDQRKGSHPRGTDPQGREWGGLESAEEEV
jgi:hypothetical protein